MTYARFRDGFAKALDPAFHTIQELDAKIVAGALFWESGNAAIVAEVRAMAGGAVLHGVCATGSLEEIVGTLIPQAEEWARRAGCTHAIIESRPGWAKALKADGYVIHTIAVRKEL